MRDPETMRIAMRGETGHLVFSRCTPTDVASTVSRIPIRFPRTPEHDPPGNAMALTAVLTQILLPASGAACPPGTAHVRLRCAPAYPPQRVAATSPEITITKKTGSFSLEESLAQLVRTPH